MVELTSILAYVMIFLEPGIILGFGAYAGDNKVTPILAYINFVVLISYFTLIGYIAQWVMIMLFIFISIIMGMMFKYIMGG